MNRAELRGRKLKSFCRRAKITKNEYGKDDNRIFCYGLACAMTEELVKECKECKANVIHAEPLERV